MSWIRDRDSQSASFLRTNPAHVQAKALTIHGQNNHDWISCQPVLKWALDDCGRFTVDVTATPPPASSGPTTPRGQVTSEQKRKLDADLSAWKAEQAAVWQQWRPEFRDYDALVSNYNGDDWPEKIQKDFVDYVGNGGGLVVVHAADNSNKTR